MNVTIIGTGYVGLVTGVCLSEVGSRVTCVDIDERKIENLKKGILPIYEPGLKEIMERNSKEQRLFFTTNLAETIRGSDIAFIAVGTPPNEDGSADLKYVLEVASELGSAINDYLLVVTKSTVPVGTSHLVKETIQKQLQDRGLSSPFEVASNPEFLKEGSAVQDFMRPDRIVAGIESEKAKELLENLYAPFILNGHSLMFMDIASAELTKYTANAMLATRISFMNEIANVCEKVGADINHVRSGIAADPRIGNKFLYSGVGYGGSCFPKDVKALINTGGQYGYPLKILAAVEAVNKEQKTVLFHKINDYFNHDLEGKNIAIWGLAFKPNTDDVRDAPALVIIEKLLAAGASVRVFDPVAMENTKNILEEKVAWSSNMYEALNGADALALVTEWNEFKLPDWSKVSGLMRQKVLFDGRNIYNKSNLLKMGFDYFGIGQ